MNLKDLVIISKKIFLYVVMFSVASISILNFNRLPMFIQGTLIGLATSFLVTWIYSQHRLESIAKPDHPSTHDEDLFTESPFSESDTESTFSLSDTESTLSQSDSLQEKFAVLDELDELEKLDSFDKSESNDSTLDMDDDDLPSSNSVDKKPSDSQPFEDDMMQELTGLLKMVKSELSSSDTITTTIPESFSSNSSSQGYENCAIIISLDESRHNRPKTYIIPNVRSHDSLSSSSHRGSLHSTFLISKAIAFMKQEGHQIQTLRPNESDVKYVTPRYKSPPSDVFSKPIQFPSNIFNLN